MNTVHPSALISDDVLLGKGNTVGPFAVITGPVVIGDDNWIGAGVVIGAPPEVRSFGHPRSESDSMGGGVVIGDRNTIREYAQVHQGWKGQTRIGDDAFIMNQCYVAHDTVIGNRVTLASSVLLAGHVSVRDGANLGLGASVHQFCEIGKGSMLGMGSVVVKEIPPFAKAFGNPASVRGANSVGMARSGVDVAVIEALAAVYEERVIGDQAVRVLATLPDAEMRDSVSRWLLKSERRPS
ncbi:acyl-ACP--UDP-N- acetylglucosamine O-acyltransferase [Microbacterium phyllosphaerae]|uniref:acyl-ACP--UDP-N- acetylglucosamine O-acyltransferase n=1 Tax=Microbacterium phyllosphaerae TaxID=124798 RepID=UPI003D64AE75